MSNEDIEDGVSYGKIFRAAATAPAGIRMRVQLDVELTVLDGGACIGELPHALIELIEDQVPMNMDPRITARVKVAEERA